ncbi:MAG TPA: hypothetical protein VKW77_04155, partial [Acidimicrobiales bacterium]|nr:hypothetical protein [Acidimicrobiales bacterium]
MSDLLLPRAATASSTAIAAELARTLETWDGPGLLVVAGNLFDLAGCTEPAAAAEASLDTHPELVAALRRFLERDDRRVVRQLGSREPSDMAASEEGTLGAIGVEPAGPLDLHLQTGTGTRVVRVAADGCDGGADGQRTETAGPGGEPGGERGRPIGPPHGAAHVAGGWRSFLVAPEEGAPWLDGLDRLGDPGASSRFVVSRILYRRLGAHVWWLLIPFAVVLLLRLGVGAWLVGHAGNGIPGRALHHARRADLGDQLAVAIGAVAAGMAALALVLWVLSRRVWSALGGGELAAARSGAAPNDAARDAARRLVGHGYAGLVSASTFEPELTHLGTGFYANVGASTVVTEEHRGRLGLPPVFVASERVSWIELETGAELHVRLMLGRRDLPSPSR